MLYDFYVGSVDSFDAHNGMDWIYRAVGTGDWKVQSVWGIWEGVTENVAQITAEFPNDAVAQRIAYALSALTGNDAVLVTRLATEFESESSMASTRSYRVSVQTVREGNRTILGTDAHGFDTPDGHPVGLAYVRDVRGSHVAYLVNRDATISPVE